MAGRQPRSVWEDPGTRYNAEAPNVQKENRRGKILRVGVWIMAFGAFPLAVVLGFVSIGLIQSMNAEKPAQLGSFDTNGSAGKPAATRALIDWLTADPSPLPNGKLISWDGFDVKEPPAPVDDTEKPVSYHFELHRFTLERNDSLYSASVQVVVDGAGVSVMGTPTLLPILDAPATASSPWFGLGTATPSEAVQSAVEEWAGAFTGGDPTALRRVTRDQDASSTYVPLAGIETLQSAKITTASYKVVPAADGKTKDDKTRMIVQVTLEVWWDGQTPTEEELLSPKPPTAQKITYDLLVLQANTDAAYVVAWGEPGTGPDLKPEANAITGVDTRNLEPGDGTPTPGPGESPIPNDTPAPEGTPAP
ncbi:hypothetical protein [Microbacterium paraoxydans]|uniref:hypothetical protein n=1 Tax=Microbacterium paraoxydans TaxID=199592 RepID=UPI0021A72119|nr:hypothetical protein [Microbacterium paraoxydans]MCT2222486.1 hypothetical protein [Microbacterium paraoxydans]